jgi:hypothetical protein
MAGLKKEKRALRFGSLVKILNWQTAVNATIKVGSLLRKRIGVSTQPKLSQRIGKVMYTVSNGIHSVVFVKLKDAKAFKESLRRGEYQTEPVIVRHEETDEGYQVSHKE